MAQRIGRYSIVLTEPSVTLTPGDAIPEKNLLCINADAKQESRARKHATWFLEVSNPLTRKFSVHVFYFDPESMDNAEHYFTVVDVTGKTNPANPAADWEGRHKA